MKKTVTLVILILISVMAKGQDTLEVNERTTLHLQCTSDIIYCDLGSNDIVAAAAPNVPALLRVKAAAPFQGETTLTVMTKDENLVTYIVRYTNRLKDYIIKQQQETGKSQQHNSIPAASVISSINAQKATLNHIYEKTLRIEFNVNNIYTYNDKVYITLGIHNKSSISYSCDVTFTLADIRSNRSTAQDIMIVPSEHTGSLTAESGQQISVTYAFDRLTIAEGKQLLVNIYESDGYRNVCLRIDSKDIANSKTYIQQQ
ncbi:MAG: DUF4138 domain-containing protein [Bacteroidales bacterium]|nr:DUF4138 domain-containing protein [Bacteroidales bacterium]